MAQHLCQVLTDLIFLKDLDEFSKSQLVTLERISHFCFLTELVWTDSLHYFLDEG